MPDESPRITDEELINQYRMIHASQRYGADCHKLFLRHIVACLCELKASSVLEFGCGQSRLFKARELRKVKYRRYDPAIPELAQLPREPVDCIINTDVMEHIPPGDVRAVLSTLKSLSENVFFHISTKPAGKVLPNGINAHCTVWPTERWIREIQVYFPSATIVFEKPGSCCTIITWPSSIGTLLHDLEVARHAEKIARKQKKSQSWLKRISVCVGELLGKGN